MNRRTALIAAVATIATPFSWLVPRKTTKNFADVIRAKMARDPQLKLEIQRAGEDSDVQILYYQIGTTPR